MDGAEVKKRVLPSWMTDENSGSKKPRPAEVRRKKKTQVAPRKRTLYCMNEKELMEFALEILNQNKDKSDTEEKHNEIPEDKEDTEEKPPISPASEELRTVPPLPDVSEDPKEDSDDDPLKYVREIFFS
ncbi:cell cycle regulator of non-homologous end joining [Hyla sarda]|uniref:cell cycle regulator of non-homologous end joining n=1 Tax=Hyla sarda TaxID=327740 RepID=UPI0024C3661C|nr:cell cycle regulator of non-homologous end joining [Hyla sarda]